MNGSLQHNFIILGLLVLVSFLGVLHLSCKCDSKVYIWNEMEANINLEINRIEPPAGEHALLRLIVNPDTVYVIHIPAKSPLMMVRFWMSSPNLPDIVSFSKIKAIQSTDNYFRIAYDTVSRVKAEQIPNWPIKKIIIY